MLLPNSPEKKTTKKQKKNKKNYKKKLKTQNNHSGLIYESKDNCIVGYQHYPVDCTLYHLFYFVYQML